MFSHHIHLSGNFFYLSWFNENIKQHKKVVLNYVSKLFGLSDYFIFHFLNSKQWCFIVVKNKLSALSDTNGFNRLFSLTVSYSQLFMYIDNSLTPLNFLNKGSGVYRHILALSNNLQLFAGKLNEL